MEDKKKIVLPAGFEEMVRGVIGDGEWDAFVEALSEEPSVSVRVNTQFIMHNAQCTMHNWEIVNGQQSTVNFIAKGSKTFGSQFLTLIRVSPSRRGRMTFSTRGSLAMKSLKALMAMV